MRRRAVDPAAGGTIRRRTLDQIIREGIRLRPEVTSRVEGSYEANLGGREVLGATSGVASTPTSLLRSQCGYLIHDPSNVPLAATILNPDLPHTDVYRTYGYP